MSDNTDYNFDDWEQSIRSGRGAQVREAISKAQNDKLSRYEKLKIANFARRVGLSELSLKLLRQLVRPAEGIKSQATEGEKAEYACALIREGLVGEGIKILQEVKYQDYPEALLYHSFGLFTRWDYETALPILRNYVNLTKNDYQKIIGNVNLIAALIFTDQIDEALKNLSWMLEQTKTDEFKLTHAFCLELKGQCLLELKEFKQAREFFEKAGNYTKHSGTNTPFLVRKWLSIADVQEDQHHKRKVSLESIEKIKTEAQNIKDWETLRTCDLHLSIANNDEELAKFVYFGTPHRKLREKTRKMVSGFTQLPTQYSRIYGSDHTQSPRLRTFDMVEARELDSDIKLKTGQTMHRLFKVLSADFYKPVRATEIFSLVFVNEYFDPSVSINRVHQAIKRLRDWIDESTIPLYISENNNSYRIESEETYALRWTDKAHLLESDSQVNMLYVQLKDQVFTVAKAAELLEMSERSMSRLIKKAVDENKLVRIGAGAQTRYQFSKK